MKILVQPRPGAAYVEVDVEILWDDISQEDIKFLAQQLLIHNLQARFVLGFMMDWGFPALSPFALNGKSTGTALVSRITRFLKTGRVAWTSLRKPQRRQTPLRRWKNCFKNLVRQNSRRCLHNYRSKLEHGESNEITYRYGS